MAKTFQYPSLYNATPTWYSYKPSGNVFSPHWMQNPIYPDPSNDPNWTITVPLWETPISYPTQELVKTVQNLQGTHIMTIYTDYVEARYASTYVPAWPWDYIYEYGYMRARIPLVNVHFVAQNKAQEYKENLKSLMLGLTSALSQVAVHKLDTDPLTDLNSDYLICGTLPDQTENAKYLKQVFTMYGDDMDALWDGWYTNIANEDTYLQIYTKQAPATMTDVEVQEAQDKIAEYLKEAGYNVSGSSGAWTWRTIMNGLSPLDVQTVPLFITPRSLSVNYHVTELKTA